MPFPSSSGLPDSVRLGFASFLRFPTWSHPAATNTLTPRVESLRDLFSTLSLWQRWSQSKLRTWVVTPKSAIIDCIPSPSATPVTIASYSTSAVLSARVRLRSGPMFRDCAVDHHHSSTCRLPLGPTGRIESTCTSTFTSSVVLPCSRLLSSICQPFSASSNCLEWDSPSSCTPPLQRIARPTCPSSCSSTSPPNF